MSSSQPGKDIATQDSGVAAIPMRFEVTTLPVADVDRAKAFYQGLGWRLDIDFMPDEHTRAVQFTPSGSTASIHFGEGLTTATGPRQRLLLIVDDVEAARADLISRGVDVSEVFHTEPGKGPMPGTDPERLSYLTYASFADPGGNGWLMQEVTERLPGRGGVKDGAALADLLHGTAVHHGAFEAVAPPQDWWDWYGAYIDRLPGRLHPWGGVRGRLQYD